MQACAIKPCHATLPAALASADQYLDCHGQAVPVCQVDRSVRTASDAPHDSQLLPLHLPLSWVSVQLKSLTAAAARARYLRRHWPLASAAGRPTMGAQTGRDEGKHSVATTRVGASQQGGRGQQAINETYMAGRSCKIRPPASSCPCHPNLPA